MKENALRMQYVPEDKMSQHQEIKYFKRALKITYTKKGDKNNNKIQSAQTDLKCNF